MESEIMKIMSVVGARPNFMKVAPIVAAIEEHNRSLKSAPDGQTQIQHLLVHTGQHYDKAMSDQFFEDLRLPLPDIFLGVGSASHAVQTAEIMRKFEAVLLEHRPHVVIVVGDVNSTLACALVTSKISFDTAGTRPLIAHVESGLRSFDRGMPEEVNRVLTDHVSDILFVTEPSGLENLQREGVDQERIHFAGNTMIDSLLTCQEQAEQSRILEKLGLRENPSSSGAHDAIGNYALLTLHRPSNVDTREGLVKILEGLTDLSVELPVIFSAHPRTQKRIEEFGLAGNWRRVQIAAVNGSSPAVIPPPAGILMTDPLGYLDFVCLMKHARLVVTDSGGVQEETTCLGVPCVTVRENTERPVTVTCGTNVIAGTSVDGIRAAIRQQLAARSSHRIPEKWDGQAAKRIIDVLKTIGNITASNKKSQLSTA